jgi:hypothetical protein
LPTFAATRQGRAALMVRVAPLVVMVAQLIDAEVGVRMSGRHKTPSRATSRDHRHAVGSKQQQRVQEQRFRGRGSPASPLPDDGVRAGSSCVPPPLPLRRRVRCGRHRNASCPTARRSSGTSVRPKGNERAVGVLAATGKDGEARIVSAGVGASTRKATSLTLAPAYVHADGALARAPDGSHRAGLAAGFDRGRRS